MNLSLRLPCDPDLVWDRLRSPEGLVHTAGPLVRVRSADPSGFPRYWTANEHRVRMTVLGVPLGRSLILLSSERRGGARVLIDRGRPESGPLALARRWKHRMAVLPARGGETLYRDRLDVHGPLVLLAWPVLWVFWQWRGARLTSWAKRVARDQERARAAARESRSAAMR